MLLGLQAVTVNQYEPELEREESRDRAWLMQAFDSTNGKHGKGTLHIESTRGSECVRDWGMKQERRNPIYTARWNELPIAQA